MSLKHVDMRCPLKWPEWETVVTMPITDAGEDAKQALSWWSRNIN